MSVLLTGATGFVGMQVLARLLARDDRDVVVAVRGPEPARRVRAALDTMRVPHALRRRVGVLPADVVRPLPRVAGVTTVVHCAASVSFGMDLDEARRINVGGTRHALEAAERSGARYVHVSTAYVSGRHSGLFLEDDLDRGQAFRNTYEQAKYEAEHLVRASWADSVVLRPSIVVGEASTGWTTSFNVLYWPLRAYSRGLLQAVPAKAQARVDVVPVDYVADAIVHITSERPDVRGTLHLVAGPDAVTVDELMGLAAHKLDRPRPVLEAEAAEELAERSDDAARYLPYFDMEVVFGDARSRSVLGPAGIAPPQLRDYFGRLVDFAQDARWGKAQLARAS
jgi:nucleoside-diphosphate-sugar epimerase